MAVLCLDQVRELRPRAVWNHFAEILQFPRPSGGEGALCDYITDWAKLRGLECESQFVPPHPSTQYRSVSHPGRNLRISIPATRGYERAPVVILQSHLDMVCERNPDSPFDAREGRIHAVIRGDWVEADGTTLGADNGIGVAAMLAVADCVAEAHQGACSGGINVLESHGPLVLLFTVDEEVGMSGAKQLTAPFVFPRMRRVRTPHPVLSAAPQAVLLNLDSEEDAVLTFGSAGGCDSHIIWQRALNPSHTADASSPAPAFALSLPLRPHALWVDIAAMNEAVPE